jgi:hypothetical protein
MVDYSSFIVSSVLSALTMTVAGNFKAVISIFLPHFLFSRFSLGYALSLSPFVILLFFDSLSDIVASVLVFGNPINIVNWLGCIVATAGVMWYNQLMTRQKITHIATK